MELHQAGGGIPDLCAGKTGIACFIECKSDETKKLTKEQERVKANWDGPYIVAWSLEDARTKLAAIFGEKG